jgi:hypothetical protein
MPITIITRRQKGVLVEASLLPAMLSMLRSQFIDSTSAVETSFTYPDSAHGTDQAQRHWSSLSEQMKSEVKRSGVSCRIEGWSANVEYILGIDMEPPARLVDVGDCTLIDDLRI